MSYGKSQESIKFAVLKQEKDSSNRNKELKEQQKKYQLLYTAIFTDAHHCTV